jgi:hypothetical protein
MAKKKAARRARRTAAKPVRKAARKTAGKARAAAKRVARRAAPARKRANAAMKKAKTAMKKKVVKAKAKKPAPPIKAAKKAAKPAVTAASAPPPAAAPATKSSRHKRPPSLDRERRTVQELHGAPSSLGPKPAASAAKTGRDELKHRLERYTSSSPALTAGDVDADWESADSSGDEAPGGDNPTPDQDVVDEIGRALGVEYDDDEELQGGDEIADRDRHRWELDPGSAEDTDDRD